ncbi:MAG: hypothetical protein WC055_06240 [Melioribacteraceae bacterium]
MKILTALTFFLLISISNAQWNFNINTGQEYNDNPFRSPIPEKNIISDYGISFGNYNKLFQFGYNGSYFALNNNPERNFYWHQIGLWRNNEFNNFGIYIEQRMAKIDYQFLDYNEYGGYFNQRFELADVFSLFHLAYTYNDFPLLTAMNNYTITLGYEGNRGFQSTGTSFILGTKFNYKNYSEEDPQIAAPAIPDDVFYNYSLAAPTPISHLTSYLRIAQSIFSKTGAAFQFTNRSILGEVNSVFLSGDFNLWEESEIFDDPIKTEGNSIALEVTQMIDDFSIKGGYYLNYRKFPSQGTYTDLENFDFTQMRSDKQSIFNLSISKNSGIEIGDFAELNLSLDYRYIKNSSNSSWFHSKGNSYSLNLNLVF